MKKILLLCLLGSLCFGQEAIINTFNAGELSPHMDARVDFEKYSSGLRTFENFICLPYGGAQKRSGTQYIDSTKSNGVARLAPFSVGVDQGYIMELGDEYIRFYQNGVRLTNELVSVYDESDVFEIQLSQFADTVYLAHADYPPQKIQRTTTAPTFTIEEVDFDWPPVLDENLTDITITPSATTGTVTLTASDDLFTADHVGSTWVLNSPNDNNQVEMSLPIGTTTSDVIRVEGEWNFRTSGTAFTGVVKIQVSLDGQQTWGTFREYENAIAGGVNYDRDGEETDAGVYYRMVAELTGAGTKAYLKNESAYVNGTVEITGFTSATVVTGVVGTALGSTDAVKTWSEGAFSAERGYPRTVEFFENRLFYGGTDYQVNTIWASKTDDYENFQTGDLDDSSLRLSINSDNIIEWMLGRNQLFIGTLGDEWILSGGDSSTPITPTTLLARRQTSFGSKDGINALIASDSIMYLQRQGRKLREFEYSFEADQYRSTDVTMIAEHITEGDILQIAEQQQPEPIVWCIRGDGQLIGMTYSKAQNVYGWHRHVTDGEFESIAVIPTEGEDRVYVVVNRDNGRYVEWFRPLDWGDDDDAWFVDSGLDYDGGASVEITDITYGTENWSLFGSSDVSLNADYVWYDVDGRGTYRYANTNNAPTLRYFEYDVAETRWELLPVPDIVGIEYYSDDTLQSTSPIHTNWYFASGISSGNLGAKFYHKDVLVTADNAFSDGDLVRLSGEGGIIWQSFVDGVFETTNCTSTNFNIRYVSDSSEVYAYGDYDGTVTCQEVKNTFTNVSHLAGETVKIFADGGVVPDETVSTNGVLQTDEYYNRVIAGLEYTSKLSPMYIEVVNSQMVSYGKYKNNYKVHFRVKDSGQFNYGSDLDEMCPVSVRLPDLPAGQPVPFYSGDRGPVSIDTSASSEAVIWVTSDEPLPLELLGMVIFTDVGRE